MRAYPEPSNRHGICKYLQDHDRFELECQRLRESLSAGPLPLKLSLLDSQIIAKLIRNLIEISEASSADARSEFLEEILAVEDQKLLAVALTLVLGVDERVRSSLELINPELLDAIETKLPR